MPIYEYRCQNGHNFEVLQSMADDPIDACEECGGLVERVFHPIAVHFKGSGFYTTDYARKGAKADASEGGSSKSDGGESSNAKSDSASNSDSKSGSTSDSGSKSSEKTSSKPKSE